MAVDPADRTPPAPNLSERVQFLSRLAGGLAHEIKNPLSTMAIHLALLEEEWTRAAAERNPERPEPTARERRCLKRVKGLQREVRRLETILEEFLRYAKGGEINRAPVDFAGLVRETLEFVAEEDERHGIRHHIDLPTTMPRVMLDEQAFRQVLMNLFVNARQAMPDGGELIVQLQRDGNFAVLTVTDTGVGMDEEARERCFDLYWSSKKSGTGLGLAMARRIVEEHDGRIEVTSEPGRGTSFRIIVPLLVEIPKSARGTVTAEGLPSRRAAPGGGATGGSEGGGA